MPHIASDLEEMYMSVTTANGVWNGITWMTEWIWENATWLADRVWNGARWLADKVWNGLA